MSALFGPEQIDAAVAAEAALSTSGREHDPAYRAMLAQRVAPALVAAVAALDREDLLRKAQSAIDAPGWVTNHVPGESFERHQAREVLAALGLLPEDVAT